MSGYFALDPRTLAPDDHAGARVLLMGALGVTPYVDRAMEVLQLAERGRDPEHRALVIARDGTVAAMALFGSVGGAFGVVRIHAAVVAPGVGTDVGARLVDAVAAAARAEHARMLVAELPDDPAVGATRALFLAAGFREEARVPDFYRDGVALSFLRRDL
jgi:L-amino acid N-acyltransferase YncA